jgi:PAS domain S-box-containing protein
MLDETKRIQKGTVVTTQSTQEQLRQLTQRLTEALEELREFQTTLRQKGMNLPPNTLETLRLTQMRLDGQTNGITGGQIELRQLRALAGTTALINSTLDTDNVLNQVMDTVIQLTGAERGFVLLKNENTGEMEFRIARGLDREQLAREDFVVSRTIINDVISSGQPVRTDNAKTDPRYEGHDSIVGHQFRSILAVPLIVRGEIIGVVYCDNRILVGLFKEHEMNLLRAFADQAAVAIQNAKLFDAARARLSEITEIRDLMDNIFASIASGLITLDQANTIIALNPAAEQITGVPADEAIGQSLGAALPVFEAVIAEQLEQVRDNGSMEYIEIELQLAGLGHRYWNVAISPLRDPDGQSQGVTMVLDDLTEQREREAQLTQVRRYLPIALVENLRSEDFAMLGGTEREITMVFADVRGFTSFSENLEPELLMLIINQYLSVASDALNLYEGVVDKYVGDAVTGLFNTQLNPQKDHALRAVRAALSMKYDVLALHEVLPPEQRLLFGIGIHTGLAVLGNVGSPERREFAAIGDALELSKLLQENAGRGEIMLSEATYAQVKDFFECEALTPAKIKGRTDFTIMYRVNGAKKRGTAPLFDFE